MSRLRPVRLAAGLALVLVWMALWGSWSIADALTGVALAVPLVLLTPTHPDRAPRTVRPGPLLRLTGLVGRDLLESTVAMATEVLTPTDHTDELLVDVTLPPEHHGHPLLLAVFVTVTPGTAVVDVSDDGGSVQVHVLHADRVDDVVAHIHQLAATASAAFDPEVTR